MIYKHLSLHSKEANPQESIAKQTNPPYCYSYSPFLRVSTPIASNHSGFYHTPRVGDEVIISYMDNDIDKPYISGSLYNLTNPSLAHLPIQDHITTLSSKTIGVNEQGRNEITLSNEKNKEVITLKAQKDYTQSINNNFSQTIHNNKDSITLGNYTESIHKTHSQNITLTKSVKVGGEYLTNVTLSKDTIVGLSHTLNVGASNKLRVAKDSSEYVGEDKSV
ncbi:bacteriophage T4 gp5 trimerisation domain-containing protein, partial [Helicobacter cinaedi]